MAGPSATLLSWRERFQSLLRQGFQWLVALWETPGVGRATICSPVVGIIAGLGATGFLICLQAMYSVVLGGVLHFHMPPTLEGKPHPITEPWPWYMVLLVPTVGGLISGILVFTWAYRGGGPRHRRHGPRLHEGGGMIRSRVPSSKRSPRSSRSARAGRPDRKDRLPRSARDSARIWHECSSCRQASGASSMLAGAAGGVGAIFRRSWARRSLPARSSTHPLPSNRPHCCPVLPARSWPTRRSPSSSRPGRS